jgi:quercetin dioxygenase-like cupin family protein
MPKRVITGQQEDGTSYFARVDELQQDFRGIGSYRVWAIDDLPQLRLPFLGREAPLASAPAANGTPEALRTAPPQPPHAGDFRLSLHRMSPGEDGGKPYEPYMHWHDTFDLQWLIAGQLTIRLDSGDEVTLEPGDVVVQHGTNHAWRAGPEGAVMGIVMYGAERTGVSPPAEDKLDTTKWQPAGESGSDANGSADPDWILTPVGQLLDRTPRRIVTGQREDGTSVFARVEDAEEDARTTAGGRDHGVVVHRIWADDRLFPIPLPFLGAAVPLASEPTAEQSAEALRTSSPHAGPGGLRVSLIKFMPNQGGREFGLHWHDTLDVQWLFAGELTIGLDDGSEVTLRPGDAVIQHGTNHRWRTGPEGAVAALVMLGVERDGVAPPPDTQVDQTPAGIAAREATS